MILNQDFLTPGQVLREIPGLARHKLMYWADKGYIKVQTQSINGRKYTNFRCVDLDLIKRAYKLTVIDGLKDKIAFDKLRQEGGQLVIFEM